MAVIQRPSARNNAVDVIKRINFLDLGGVNDFHAEANVVGNPLHVVKPVEIRLLSRNANTARGVPAHVLTGLFFKRGIKSIAVVMNFGEVVVAYKARALPRRVPGRPRRQLALFDEHDVGLTLLGKMVSECHTHNAAAHDDDPSLRLHDHAAPTKPCTAGYRGVLNGVNAKSRPSRCACHARSRAPGAQQ